MAEDDLDLEDDDLDLGGDDFAGELDDMMGDDELGGDSGGGGGGDDSDSELDSFFEDLSSIEDMDEGGGEPAAEAPEPDDDDDDVPAAPAKVKKAKPPKEKKGGKMKIILPLLLFLLLGGGGAWWWLNQEPEIAVEELPIIEEQPIRVVEMAQPEPVRQPVQPIIEVEPAPPPPVKPVVPRTKYLIQVATCTYDVCKEDYADSLRRDGEPVFQRSSGEKYDFIELISKQVFSSRDAAEIVKEINRKNEMAGNAFVKSQSNGYRVSMGSFPALDKAKEVKFNVEKIFPGKNVSFSLEHVRRDYSTTKIYAGPYDSRGLAKRVLADLRSKQKYRGAFIVRY